jgi:integrase/recombinase XerD
MPSLSFVIEKLLFEEQSRNLAKSSYADLKRNFSHFNSWCDSHLNSLRDLTPQFLLKYLLEEHHSSGFSTKKTFIWSLRKLGAFLLFHNYLPENPAAALKHPKKSSRQKLPEYLSKEEMRQLLLASSDNLLHFTLVSIFLNTGLRPADLEDISLFQYFPNEGYFTGIAKGGLHKRTPLSDSLILLINEYLEDRPFKSQYLLVNKHGKSLKKASMQQIIKEITIKSGLTKNVTARMLRHTFATHFTDRHGSIMCKALLGHGSHRNTRVYVHLSPSHFRQLMNNHPFNREYHLYERF